MTTPESNPENGLNQSHFPCPSPIGSNEVWKNKVQTQKEKRFKKEEVGGLVLYSVGALTFHFLFRN